MTTSAIAPLTSRRAVGPLDVVRLDLRLRRRATIGYAVGLALYALAVVAIYPSFKGDTSIDRLLQSNPKLYAAFGVSGSLTSPVGWLNANVFNNFLPVVTVILAIGYGAWCIAGQDESGTLAPIAVLPISRRGVVVQKVVALAVQLLPTLVLTTICVLVGRTFQLNVGIGNLVAASVACWLLGLVFGALALVVGAASGSRGLAIGVSSAVAAAAYLISSFAASIDWIRPMRLVSPFYWAAGSNPLGDGIQPGAMTALIITAAALVGVAVTAANRADLH
ncbi:MAG TPA: ABC transporter permease subunit [Acidothermaceae bacterium]|jgi:ABC-2 type transport system permease protein|nr:ABC transporter permease subunit [Acidothermaceae bacterium]